MSNTIFLIGPSGVGKTTIGNQLAKRLNWTFADSDHAIVSRFSQAISDIFAQYGEVVFRERESLVIEELSQQENIVIATGGGAVLSRQNRDLMQQRGDIIYLYASLETLVHRITDHRDHRPLLQVDDLNTKISKLLSERCPLYDEIANLIIDTNQKTVASIIDEIAEHLILSIN